MTITMMIAYLKDSNFDMEYYLQRHLPMVTPLWKPFGMGTFRTMAPTDERSPYAMLTQIEWPDMDAFNRAQVGTPAETSQKFMEDIKNFTDKDPVIWFMENKASDA
ncbi:uncharacterized protein GGS22DRAFT_176572 [Annulohypoxylon maeteangense]|uniref:uncharacterized protein n=1 Tax=Annulohypoxylon maeteangense TaxID=1927788 RepID=UPI0020080CE8|nr:uncharacterized protein GGS22DRAFT_176572 [Annulohypoxylon maeteangense]KAI0879856.1 hypothetical protein GGS22DRAFT_176572 [Annulohypoxylon maeteangense]